ncbi:MAG: hypothetical protein ABSC06_40020 [Rhodopila sp.]
MTNLECALAVLVKHREARGWQDEAVALDLLAQLGLDAAAEAANAAPVVDPSLVSEAEVVAAEAAAKAAADKARAARDALNAQTEAEAKAHADVAADQAKAATDAREAAQNVHPESSEA